MKSLNKCFFFDQVEDSFIEDVIPNDESVIFENNIGNRIGKEVSCFQSI